MSHLTLKVTICSPTDSTRTPSPGSQESAQILELLRPALDRLNRVLRPRPTLELQDLANLAELCAFDSQAYGTDFLSWSEWCHLFGRDEWEVLGYAKEVARWYQVGQGSVSQTPNPHDPSLVLSRQTYGPTMGVCQASSRLYPLTHVNPGWLDQRAACQTDGFFTWSMAYDQFHPRLRSGQLSERRSAGLHGELDFRLRLSRSEVSADRQGLHARQRDDRDPCSHACLDGQFPEHHLAL